jgi:putative DNA primase/helicase
MRDNNVSASNGQAGPYTFVLESALEKQAAGRSVLPIAPGSKAPSVLSPTTGEIIEISWKAHQKTPATREQLIKWLRVPHPMGIGIACGPVSGITLDDGIRAALEVLDFDAWQVYEAFVELTVVQGLDDLLARLHLKEQTPRPGIHLPYLCIEVAKNTPLAREKVGTLPNGQDLVKALIETRGIGGQVVVAPTPPGIHPHCPTRGYELLSGSWLDIPLITPEERQSLWNCARALNRYTPQENRSQRHREPRSDIDRVGSDYNERVTQEEELHLLESHGWQHTYTRNDAYYLLRPGKSGRGWSATLGELARWPS